MLIRQHRRRKQRRIGRAGGADGKVATGTPLGICAIDRSESMPLKALD